VLSRNARVSQRIQNLKIGRRMFGRGYVFLVGN
jgi:hypothetical protein